MTADTRVDPANLRLMRKTRHLTQEELSIAAGLSLRTVQRAERDGSISFSTLKSLAAAFEVDAEDLEARPEQTSQPGLLAGLACGLAGVLLGGAFSLRGQLTGLTTGTMTATEFGWSAGLTGAALGLACALLGLTYQRYRRRNPWKQPEERAASNSRS